MAGVVGLEPTIPASKAGALTTWPYPCMARLQEPARFDSRQPPKIGDRAAHYVNLVYGVPDAVGARS